MKNLKKIHKRYQKSRLLPINIIGKIYVFHHKMEWEKFESSNKTITLNILYVPYNTEKIRHPYISKHK